MQPGRRSGHGQHFGRGPACGSARRARSECLAQRRQRPGHWLAPPGTESATARPALQRDLIIAHELTHWRRGDLWWLVACALQRIDRAQGQRQEQARPERADQHRGDGGVDFDNRWQCCVRWQVRTGAQQLRQRALAMEQARKHPQQTTRVSQRPCPCAPAQPRSGFCQRAGNTGRPRG
ncbi:MAG: hypothetical protein EOO78_38065 [Oxalobacteraceae bacterium]|nr:MAG: hypothetical protein EOO78_38065 [Oxalobacteraceae bacterium]